MSDRSQHVAATGAGADGAVAGPGAAGPGGAVSAPGQVGGVPVAARRGGRIRLLLLFIICVAPVVASYLVYYVFPPGGRTNYGELIDPQRPLPAFTAQVVRRGDAPESLEANGLAALRGRWILLTVDGGGCDRRCAEKLFFQRQTHASLGRDRDRVAQVLLLTDSTRPVAELLQAHPDLVILDASVAVDVIRTWLPTPATSQITDHLFIIDPLQNLMMRFPRDPDPARVRKDLQKLLKASRIG
jgi:hypothetical protein